MFFLKQLLFYICYYRRKESLVSRGKHSIQVWEYVNVIEEGYISSSFSLYFYWCIVITLSSGFVVKYLYMHIIYQYSLVQYHSPVFPLSSPPLSPWSLSCTLLVFLRFRKLKAMSFAESTVYEVRWRVSRNWERHIL